MSKHTRAVSVAMPAQAGRLQGLAYTLWLPPQPRGGVVILHGAGSQKESHHDFARVIHAAGLASICFDQRGHGASGGALDDRAAQDVATMASLLRTKLDEAGMPDARSAPIALRGSSMGGYLAIVAAPLAQAQAVVAICPAPSELLRFGLSHDRFEFAADKPALDEFLAENDLSAAVAELEVPLLLLHADGDEQVPVESSRELAEHAAHPSSRLIVVPGGHHRSIQHDGELQAVSLRFLTRQLTAS
jgi:uncharacterized protein